MEQMGQRWLVRRERFDWAFRAALASLETSFLLLLAISNLLGEAAGTNPLVAAIMECIPVQANVLSGVMEVWWDLRTCLNYAFANFGMHPITIDPSKLSKATPNPKTSSQKVTKHTFLK
jgi:hypothetical protein